MRATNEAALACRKLGIDPRIILWTSIRRGTHDASMADEIVRLKHNHPEDGLKAGDCGLIWGVYKFDPPLYEACFVDEFGEFVDMTFEEEEVEQLDNPQQAPFIERLEHFRQMLDNFGAKLREKQRQVICRR